jgi:ATP adenylyltransferase
VEYLWTSWRMSYIESLNGRSEACVFCAKLDADDEEELVLRRGDTCYICLNRFPYTAGHLLIVPNDHVDTIENLAP